MTSSSIARAADQAGVSARYQHYRAVPLDPNKPRRRRRARMLIQIAMPALILLVWQLIASLSLIDQRFFSSPGEVLGALGDLAADGTLGTDVAATIRRLLIGLLLGGILGVLVGIAMGQSWIVNAAMRPIISATYPIPKIALLPVMLLIFGAGDQSLIMLVGSAVFYVMVVNTAAGLDNISRIYRDIAKTYEVGRGQFIRTIALPFSLPFIFAGVRLSTAVGLLALIAAEFTSADAGLGRLILRSWQVFNVEQMYAGIVVSGAIGWLAYLLIDLIEKRVVHWRTDI